MESSWVLDSVTSTTVGIPYELANNLSYPLIRP